MEFLLNNWPDILMLVSIFLIGITGWKRPSRQCISLLVISEQCISYFVYFCLFTTPLLLKITSGTIYICLYFVIVNFKIIDKSISWIAKFYLFTGIYHLLMAIEPFVLSNFNSNLTPYLYSAHWFFNIFVNLSIISLVIFGGSFGKRRTKHAVFDCDNNYIEHYHFVDNKIAHKRKW